MKAFLRHVLWLLGFGPDDCGCVPVETCYICDPGNPDADEEGCRNCEREAFAVWLLRP